MIGDKTIRLLSVSVILSEAKDLVFPFDVPSFPNNEILRRFAPQNDLFSFVIPRSISMRNPYDEAVEFAAS